MHSKQLRVVSSQTRTRCKALLFGVACGLVFIGRAVGAPQAGGVPAAGPKVRMVRSVAGTKGETRGGNYIILDPRTTF